ncbi:HET-domain-containing protein [Nemania serpens]|nr:HET-domain-containing protein [Nemania serpens]
MDYTNPHSCQHCQSILLSRPEDDPDLHEGSEPRQSLLLLKALRTYYQKDPILKKLENTYLLEVNAEKTAGFVSDGCLFYQFISTGLEQIAGQLQYQRQRRALRPYNRVPPIDSNTSRVPDSNIILIELNGNAVEIRAVHDTSNGYVFLERNRSPTLLHSWSPVAEKFEVTAHTNISSDESFAQVRGWLQNCIQNHPECSHPASEFVPTRLLKIWTSQGTRLIQLIEPNGSPVRYAALSYCWGGEQDVRTTQHTFSRHRTRIDFQGLPQTIKDAVIVTEKLGIEYLWVDALCIIQDDEEDRAREIDLMGHVYEKAEITIMASRAEAVQSGFLQNLLPYGHEKPDWVFKLHYRHLSGQISPLVIAPTRFRTSVDHLSTRAWAFQERLFSYRILEYSSTCVHWSCQSQRDCDRRGDKCYAADLEQGIEIFRGLRDHKNSAFSIMTWNKLVNTFSRKSLTLSRDRLPAIGGIAERFGLRSDVEYLAGIWRSSLPSGLLWVVDRYPVYPLANKSYQPRSPTYLAPSWSWASTTQPVDTRFYVVHGVAMADFVGVDIGHQVEGTKYGRVTHGYLTLRGFLTPVLWTLPGETEQRDRGRITQGHSELSISVFTDAVETDLLPEGADNIQAYLLVLFSKDDRTRVTGLLLRKHPDDGDRYSRLGAFGVPYCEADQKEYPTMARGLLQGEPEEVTIM